MPGPIGPIVDANQVPMGTSTNPLYVAGSSSAPVPVYTPDGFFSLAGVAFNRPADTTAYAAGDLVANSTTSGSVAPIAFANAVRSAGQACRIERMRLRKSGTSLTNASFRVYLFRTSPTVSVGDNGVFNSSGTLAISDIADLIDYFDITMNRSATVGARGLGVPSTGSGVNITPTSGTTLYALIEATAAYTPVSGETFTATLEGALG